MVNQFSSSAQATQLLCYDYFSNANDILKVQSLLSLQLKHWANSKTGKLKDFKRKTTPRRIQAGNCSCCAQFSAWVRQSSLSYSRMRPAD